MSRGYLTLAAGKPRFLEMAVDMALSLREHSDLPVACAVDEPTGDLLASRYPRVFDTWSQIPQRFLGGRSLKYGVAEASPFEETAFVDADCFVLAPLDHAWSALEDTDLAMLGELLGPDDDENHHGFSTRRLMKRFGLERYLKTNSGFFVFRREGAREILEACLTCYREEVLPSLRWQILLGRWVGDEIAFGVVGGRRRLPPLPKPGEMYWPGEFADIDLHKPAKPLLHMIWPLPERTLEDLCAAARARRTAAGLPDSDMAHWREEQAALLAMARRRRLLETLRVW